jgi:Protein of unknown function (DUF2490)
MRTALTLAAASISVQAQAPLKSDTQFWNDLQLTVPMNKQVDFVITLTTRTRRNITVLADERWGVGWVIKANKYLSFNPFYFHREADPPHLRHEREDRLTLGATLRFPVRKFTLVERNWFERRWREPQVDAWRYRARGQVERPFTINKTKFTGYVADEIFYDWSVHDWVRNRFTLGANHAFNKHFTLDLYLMRQNDGRTRPGDLTILGSQMRFRL